MINCRDCKFWETIGDPNESLNECRLYPPITGKLVTKRSHCCGQGVAKEGPKKGKGKGK